MPRAKAACQRMGTRRLAALAGVDPANLSKVLNGRKRMGTKRVEALPQVLARLDAGRVQSR